MPILNWESFLLFFYMCFGVNGYFFRKSLYGFMESYVLTTFLKSVKYDLIYGPLFQPQ